MNNSLHHRMRELLNTFVDRYNVPAVICGVLTQDGSVDVEVVGVRRRSSSIPATKQDRWHIGSCGKSITAVLYAKLVERGDAEWGIPVGELFSDLSGEIDRGWADRTIDEIFHCRAGMRANLSISEMKKGWVNSRPLTEQRSDAVLSALKRPPKPRGRFVYSNLGYIVIGAAIDRLASMPYENALKMRLLEPLDINSLGYGPPPEVWGHRPRYQLGNICVFQGAPADPNESNSDNPRVLSSAGTMHLNLTDWAKFHRLFLTAGGELLEPRTIDHLLRVPTGRGTPMTMGWVKADGIKGVSLGMQGSNTMWSAAAVIDERRERTSLIVCNDGRTRVVLKSAELAASLLNI